MLHFFSLHFLQVHVDCLILGQKIDANPKLNRHLEHFCRVYTNPRISPEISIQKMYKDLLTKILNRMSLYFDGICVPISTDLSYVNDNCLTPIEVKEHHTEQWT